MNQPTVDPMPILIEDIQAAQGRLTEAARAYVEARAELRALRAHYTRVMQAVQAAEAAAAQASEVAAG